MKNVLVVDTFHPSVFLRRNHLEKRTSSESQETFLKCSFKLAFAVVANASIGRMVAGLGTYRLRKLVDFDGPGRLSGSEGLTRRWRSVTEEDVDSESLEQQL